jgi:hypothetical protein
MGTTRGRLDRLETVWSRPATGWRERFDPGLLTEDELAEYVAIDRRSRSRNRQTIGQLTTTPIDPYGVPPGPVIRRCCTSPRTWNSSVTWER